MGHDVVRGSLQTGPRYELAFPVGARAAIKHRIPSRILFSVQIVLFLGSVMLFIMLYRSFAWAAAAGYVYAAVVDKKVTTTSDPLYFQTTPEFMPGPTATGEAPFLAETNPAPFLGTSYIPNSPLETQVPIAGNTNDGNIFQVCDCPHILFLCGDTKQLVDDGAIEPLLPQPRWLRCP